MARGWGQKAGEWWRTHRPIWLILLLIGLFGTALVYGVAPPQERRHEVVAGIGVALLVAATVGILALLHEFHAIFMRALEEMLVDQRFLDALDPRKLADIGAKAFKASVSRLVTNNRHEWEQMYQVVSTEVLALVREPHRVGYEEHVDLTFMNIREAAERLRLPIFADPGREVCLNHAITSFQLISPQSGRPSDYDYEVEEQVEVIPGLADADHVQATIQIDDGVPTAISLEASRSGDLVTISGQHKIRYDGSCRVRIEMRVWDRYVPFVLIRMAALTRDFYISVVTNKALAFNSYVFALGGTTHPEVVQSHSFQRRHTGWLLPNHGAVVYWM